MKNSNLSIVNRKQLKIVTVKYSWQKIEEKDYFKRLVCKLMFLHLCKNFPNYVCFSELLNKGCIKNTFNTVNNFFKQVS